MKFIEFQEINFRDDSGNMLEIHIEKYKDGVFGYSIFLYEKQKDMTKAQIFSIDTKNTFDNAIDAFKEAKNHLKSIFERKNFGIMILDNPCNIPFIDIEAIKKNVNDLKVKEFRINGRKVY